MNFAPVSKPKSKSEKTKKGREVFVVLCDVRSALNVGSIFRTADCAGVSKIFLAGYTPAPEDEFGRPRKQISKTALGAEKNIQWEKTLDCAKLLRRLKKQGIFIVAVEQDLRSIDYRKVKLPEKCALVFGNEVEGLPKKILDLSRVVAEIPMVGKKESLNVAVSAGIAIFRMLGI